MSPIPLSESQLDRLAAALGEHHAPILSRLNPGLDAAEIKDRLRQIGVDLPPELQLWWEWHNGASLNADDTDVGDVLSIGPEVALLTVDEAIGGWTRETEIAAEVRSEDPAAWWNPTWLPFTSAPVAVDCGLTSDGCSVVRNTDPTWDAYERGPQITASLGEMVEIWILALEQRIWYWDPNVTRHGAWRQDNELVTPELSLTGQF